MKRGGSRSDTALAARRDRRIAPDRLPRALPRNPPLPASSACCSRTRDDGSSPYGRVISKQPVDQTARYRLPTRSTRYRTGNIDRHANNLRASVCKQCSRRNHHASFTIRPDLSRPRQTRNPPLARWHRPHGARHRCRHQRPLAHQRRGLRGALRVMRQRHLLRRHDLRRQAKGLSDHLRRRLHAHCTLRSRAPVSDRKVHRHQRLPHRQPVVFAGHRRRLRQPDLHRPPKHLQGPRRLLTLPRRPTRRRRAPPRPRTPAPAAPSASTPATA